MELVSEKKQLIGFITLEGALGITVLTCGTACNVWTLQAVSVLPPPCIEAAEAWEFNVFLQPASCNCLFRALGDQLEGHSRNHLKHRQETVDYMIKQREDFEPFVEDDIPFEKHVASLAKPGTFAGNDAIVAFARNHQLNVVIHQLNAPLWQIRGTEKSSVRELHIAYRCGEHYDSVRRLNDNSEAPAHLQTDFQMLHQDESNKREKIKTKGIDFEDDLRDEVEDAVQKVCNATGCSDFNLIVQNLEAENYNIESAIIAMLQMNQGKRNKENLESGGRVLKQCGPLWEEGGSGTRLFGNQGVNEGRTENNKERASPSEENKANKNQLPKVTNKQRREQQRLEKKKRQEERHRHKALESRSGHRDSSRSEAEANTQVTLVKTFAALNI
ncbi:OTU domain-containing protein 3 isoform X3 [Canis lupus familiaris]|uniref:OTU domain-containing protein 3 isoform X3 n=1 Tax=Canis lupus familiaris TaxID=9615 RepID=UPI0015F18022|nr:OTU domain-containing protein 3 isoform X3 [Canis lupus familiaris]XP_038387700.1 OTU domain-containing protein 3 isoform X3 [Canis lupus familiaris]XP_038516042.1 OTU domain-containing protein 3 isoform X3 [Canis lupus familiaris]